MPGSDVPSPDAAEPLPRPEPITQLPILVLFPHNRCNCRCLMCDIWRIRKKEEIAPEDVLAWRDEWRRLGVRRVVLSGGEALMHSRLWELCEILRDAEIAVTILSSGLLLARHAGQLVRYTDDVIVSLDGPRELHDQIRNVRGAFDLLEAGVAALRRAQGAAGSEGGLRITARSVVQRANYQALRATVAAAHALGLDGISFLAVDVSSEAFNRPGGWPAQRAASVALAREDLPKLAAELRSLEVENAADFSRRFIAESPRKLWRRLYQYFAALLGLDDFYPNDCNAPWVSAVIETDGTVRPCFFHRPLGRLDGRAGLAEVLNSPSAIAWRRELDTRTNPICRRCVLSLAVRSPAPDGAAPSAG
jgi:MoaA/NifB/PqqE/SkfB family radical SAM enzyme